MQRHCCPPYVLPNGLFLIPTNLIQHFDFDISPSFITLTEFIHDVIKGRISVSMFKGETMHTYSSTSRLKGFLLLPKNSPIIWRLRPFLWRRKWATPMGVSGMKPREMRNWRPLSGFLHQGNRQKYTSVNYSLCRSILLDTGLSVLLK